MSKEKGDLDEIMRELGARRPAPVPPKTEAIAPLPPADATNASLSFLNQSWNLSSLPLESRRAHFSGVMTLYKKLLALILRPFINVALYKQAAYNEQVAHFGNKLWERLLRHEEMLNRIAQQLNQWDRRLEERLSLLQGTIQEMRETLVGTESCGQMRGALGEHLRARFDRADRRLEEGLGELQRELRSIELGLRKMLNQKLNALTQVVLEDLGDEEAGADDTP